MILVKDFGDHQDLVELPDGVAKRMLATNPSYSLPEEDKEEKPKRGRPPKE